MEAALANLEAVYASTTAGAGAEGAATFIDLADALGPILWMAEAADALVEDVSDCILEHEQASVTRGGFGPIDGLSWTIGVLVNAVAQVKRMAEALVEQDARAG